MHNVIKYSLALNDASGCSVASSVDRVKKSPACLREEDFKAKKNWTCVFTSNVDKGFLTHFPAS